MDKPIVKKVENTASFIVFEVFIDNRLNCFDGHFDEQPVLPGVYQIDLAIDLGVNEFSIDPDFQGMRAIKFQKVIIPECVVLLKLSYSKESRALSFKYYSGNDIFSSGRVII